jgi:hypothetical protein
MLKVTFIGEPAVDDGGPQGKFFFRCVHIGVKFRQRSNLWLWN